MSPKRPRDPARLVKRLVEVASRIAHEAIEPTEKDPAAVSLGRKGGRPLARGGSAAPDHFRIVKYATES